MASYDTMRAMGALAIVYLHIIGGWADDIEHGITFYTQPPLRIFLNSVIEPLLVRWGVPIFFMISGALILDPHKVMPIKKTKKYIARMISVLLMFGYSYCLMELVVSAKSIKLSFLWTGFMNLLEAKNWAHMWYLYSLIGLYILTPLLKAAIQKLDHSTIRFITISFFIFFIVIPTVNSIFTVSITTFDLSTKSGALFYFWMGFVLKHTSWAVAIRKKTLYLTLAESGTVLILLQLYGISRAQWFVDPQFLWIALYSCSLFLLLTNSRLCEKFAQYRWIQLLSKHSFCIYLIHPVFINLLSKAFGIFPDYLPLIIGEGTLWILVSLLSLAGSVVLHRIPYLKKII